MIYNKKNHPIPLDKQKSIWYNRLKILKRNKRMTFKNYSRYRISPQAVEKFGDRFTMALNLFHSHSKDAYKNYLESVPRILRFLHESTVNDIQKEIKRLDELVDK